MTTFFDLYRQEKGGPRRKVGSLAVFPRMIRRHPVPRKLWKTCWQGAFWRVTRHHWIIALQTLGWWIKLYENSGQWCFFFGLFFAAYWCNANMTKLCFVWAAACMGRANNLSLARVNKATSSWNCWNSWMHASCALAGILFETLFLTHPFKTNPRFSENPSLLVCARLSWLLGLTPVGTEGDNFIALLSTL